MTRLPEKTVGGLHDFVEAQVLRRYARPGKRAVDLGAGSGAFALRLRALGMDVLAVERNTAEFQADVPVRSLDLDMPDFAAPCGPGSFDMVTSLEVIEHVESPISFLRNVAALLAPGGTAILTTPNVDNVPARVKFLLRGRLRMMDEQGDRTHISPIFLDLLRRQYLPRVGLRLREHHVYPANGFLVTRPLFAWPMRLLARVLPGEALAGDNHVFVLQRADSAQAGAQQGR